MDGDISRHEKRLIYLGKVSQTVFLESFFNLMQYKALSITFVLSVFGEMSLRRLRANGRQRFDISSNTVVYEAGMMVTDGC